MACPSPNAEVAVDGDVQLRQEAVAEPARLNSVDAGNSLDRSRRSLDAVDDRRVDGVHEAVPDLAGRAAEDSEYGDGDAQPDDGIGAFEACPHADGPEGDGEGGEAVRAGVVTVGDEGR